MKQLKKYLNINLKGKSPAFYLKKKINCLTIKTIQELTTYSEVNKTDARICLHESNMDKLQFMINVLTKKKKYYYNYHPKTDEYYFILSGKLLLIYFDKKIKKKKILENKSTKIFKLRKNILHVTIPITKNCTFLEIREGPFRKNKDAIFSNTFETNQNIK